MAVVINLSLQAYLCCCTMFDLGRLSTCNVLNILMYVIYLPNGALLYIIV